jgi:hypothetical protein
MSSQSQQQLKFRKCQNEGRDIMIAFRRKTDGSNGWSAVEKDSVGQLVIHRCMGKRRASSYISQQQVSDTTSHTSYGLQKDVNKVLISETQIATITEVVSALEKSITQLRGEVLALRGNFHFLKSNPSHSKHDYVMIYSTSQSRE